MAKKSTPPSSEGLPSGLAQPAIRALKSAGFSNLQQISKATESELMELHGMGPNAMLKVKEALRKAGLSLAKPRKT